MTKRLLFLSGILSLIQVDCGALYPDDIFKEMNSGFINYYYLTNTSYQINNGAIPMIKEEPGDQIFFLIDQRDDVYYNKGFEFEENRFDTRWFLQLENPNATNYFFFSNTEFGSAVNFHYYELGGSAVPYTTGYLLITQAGSRDWYVEARVGEGDTIRSISAIHRLAIYDADNESFSFIE